MRRPCAVTGALRIDCIGPLDVTFQEDQCRIRMGHADANFSILHLRTALSLLKNEATLKVGIKNKRLNAGWDESYLEKVLLGT